MGEDFKDSVMIKEYERQGLTATECNSIHKWVNKRKRKTRTCRHCGEVGKKMENALIKGKRYERNIKNFIRLCISCHKKYDMTEERKALLKSLASGRTVLESTKLKVSRIMIEKNKKAA